MTIKIQRNYCSLYRNFYFTSIFLYCEQKWSHGSHEKSSGRSVGMVRAVDTATDTLDSDTEVSQSHDITCHHMISRVITPASSPMHPHHTSSFITNHSLSH